jgi:hypothetical protein
MGELGRYGPQLPQNEAAQREHFKEVDEDLRRDEKADRVVKGHSPRPRWRIGYLVVLAGAAGFLTSCFVPYYGSGVFGPGSETVSLYQQGSFGSDSVGWGRLGSLLFLFGGVATVAFLAIAGVTQRGPHTAAAMLAATVVAWFVDVDRDHDPRGHVGARDHAGMGLLGPSLERRRGGYRNHRCCGYRTGGSEWRGHDVATCPPFSQHPDKQGRQCPVLLAVD